MSQSSELPDEEMRQQAYIVVCKQEKEEMGKWCRRIYVPQEIYGKE
jgi:hypothetical protein